MTSRGIWTKGVGMTSSSRSEMSVFSLIILSLRNESNSPELACVVRGAWCVAWCVVRGVAKGAGVGSALWRGGFGQAAERRSRSPRLGTHAASGAPLGCKGRPRARGPAGAAAAERASRHCWRCVNVEVAALDDLDGRHELVDSAGHHGLGGASRPRDHHAADGRVDPTQDERRLNRLLPDHARQRKGGGSAHDVGHGEPAGRSRCRRLLELLCEPRALHCGLLCGVSRLHHAHGMTAPPARAVRGEASGSRVERSDWCRHDSRG